MTSMRSRALRHAALVAGLAGLLGSAIEPLAAQSAPLQESATRNRRTAPWPTDLVEAFRHLPLQDDGRIKPLLTHVSYLLLRLNGRREVTLPQELQSELGELAGTTLKPTEWAMDVLLFPRQADRYPIFQVHTSEVIDAIGLEHEGKRKRDRYSFAELRPGLQKLVELARSYGHIDAKKRTGLQEQVVNLATNVLDYDGFARSFDAARFQYPARGAGLLEKVFGDDRPVVRFSDIVDEWPKLVFAFQELHKQQRREDGVPEETRQRQAREIEGLERLLRGTESAARSSSYLHLFPPGEVDNPVWFSVGEWAERLLWPPHGSSDPRPEPGPLLATQRLHEELVSARQDPERMRRVLDTLQNHVTALMAKRGEGDTVAMEVDYLLADYFWNALYVFGLAFLLVIATWLRPRSFWIGVPAWIAAAAGGGILIYGIVIRCILRSRPPISTLYDTILFITAACVVFALLLELLNRRKIFLSLAALLGFFGMFFANSFETMDGRDTMPTLLAVLDTNFWLATHVTVINLGYAGALMAGFIAHLFLLGQLFGIRHRKPALFRYLGRTIYGAVCFTALFATVGTILGGIWANDSWGRFWGWDPKENGALMIVLWTLATLHLRLGGYIKDFGLAMMAVGGNMVVVFSWFHTNQLGVGLHAYGFNSKLASQIWAFYGTQAGVLGLGVLGRAIHNHLESRASAPAARAAAAPDTSSGEATGSTA